MSSHLIIPVSLQSLLVLYSVIIVAGLILVMLFATTLSPLTLYPLPALSTMAQTGLIPYFIYTTVTAVVTSIGVLAFYLQFLFVKGQNAGFSQTVRWFNSIAFVLSVVGQMLTTIAAVVSIKTDSSESLRVLMNAVGIASLACLVVAFFLWTWIHMRIESNTKTIKIINTIALGALIAIYVVTIAIEQSSGITEVSATIRNSLFYLIGFGIGYFQFEIPKDVDPWMRYVWVDIKAPVAMKETNVFLGWSQADIHRKVQD